MEVIRGLARTKTVLLISHRLANGEKADRIYVLDQGRIAEQGDHRELLEKNGIYAKMYKAQKALEEYGLTAEKRRATA